MMFSVTIEYAFTRGEDIITRSYVTGAMTMEDCLVFIQTYIDTHLDHVIGQVRIVNIMR